MKKILLIFLCCTGFVFSQTELTHEVYFDTDEFVVPLTEQNRLLLFIRNLEKNNIEKISIYGFCDDVGSDSYNLKLSQQRANAIKTIFSEYEIDGSIIKNVDGKGEVLLKIINTKDANIIRGLNRKVEIIASINIPKIEEEKTSELKEVVDLLKGDLSIGDTIILENILFETGHSNVLPESEKTLENIANILKDRKDISFTIQGHVCCTKYARDAVDRKTKKRNLSVARARYIYFYLSKKGVNKKRMKYVGMRRKFPLGGEAKFDRRVEILITNINSNKK